MSVEASCTTWPKRNECINIFIWKQHMYLHSLPFLLFYRWIRLLRRHQQMPSTHNIITVPIPIPSYSRIFSPFHQNSHSHTIHVWYIYLHFPYKSTKCRQIFHSHGSSWHLSSPLTERYFQTSKPYSLRLAWRASVLMIEDDFSGIQFPKWPWWDPTYGDERLTLNTPPQRTQRI